MNRGDRRFALRLRAPKTSSARLPRLELRSLEDRTVPTTFHVTSLADSGAGTLRDAIDQANASTGPDQIVFDVPGTVTLESPLSTIFDDVRIYGLGAANTTVTRDSAAGSFGIFAGSGSTNMAFIGMTITGGNGGAGGAVTATTGTTTIQDCAVINNTGIQGGAVFMPVSTSGWLRCIDSNISGNTGECGGIYFDISGNLLVDGCTISNNTGTSTTSFYGGGIIFYGTVGPEGIVIKN